MRVHPLAMAALVALIATTQGSGNKPSDQSQAPAKSRELPKVDFGVLSRKEDEVKVVASSGSTGGRALEELCPQGFVECDGGFAVVNGTTNTTLSCEEACNGYCCVGNTFLGDVGRGACGAGDGIFGLQPGFNGKVCKDGSSCMGKNSCVGATIPYVVNSCTEERSCFVVGQDGTVGTITSSCIGFAACASLAKSGSVGDITSSCIGRTACDRLGRKGGSVGDITASCTAIDADITSAPCYYFGYDGGFVGDITASCNGKQVCRRLGQKGGSVGDITASCNGEQVCLRLAYNSGSIGDISSSCNETRSCSSLAEGGGSVGNITSSCKEMRSCYGIESTNGRDLYTCCNGAISTSAPTSSLAPVFAPLGVCEKDSATSLPVDCSYLLPPTLTPTSTPTSIPTSMPTSASTSSPTTVLKKCEGEVEHACVPTEFEKYGRLMSCVAKAIKSKPECDDAIAASNGKGIGHILSDESMFWVQDLSPKGGLRRRQQEATSSCGSAALSLCNNTCPGTDSDVEERSMWFACLDQAIYDDVYNNTEFDIAECEGELTDEDAWDLVAVTCGWEADGLFN